MTTEEQINDAFRIIAKIITDFLQERRRVPQPPAPTRVEVSTLPDPRVYHLEGPKFCGTIARGDCSAIGITSPGVYETRRVGDLPEPLPEARVTPRLMIHTPAPPGDGPRHALPVGCIKFALRDLPNRTEALALLGIKEEEGQ